MRADALGLHITLDVEGKHAVVVGGGAEAEDKATRLLEAGARVTVVASDPAPSLSGLAQAGRVTLFARDFVSGDLHDADLVLVCERDEALAARAFATAEEIGVAMWACDDPAHSHFAMPALARLGRARVAISTSGAAPALAGKLRAALERDLGPRFAAFVDRLGAERARLRESEPDAERRRDQLRHLVDDFELHTTARYPDDEE